MSRKIFSEFEKVCLQELILKHKINSLKSNIGAKRDAWKQLVTEFNAIESNTKRTEAQLRKCWDNLKTRRKIGILKKEGTKTNDSLSNQAEFEEDSEDQPASSFFTSDTSILIEPSVELTELETEQQSPDPLGFQRTRYQRLGTKTMRPNALLKEFKRRIKCYNKANDREEELHKLKIAESKLLLKAAEEKYKKKLIERIDAEEMLKHNRMKREKETL